MESVRFPHEDISRRQWLVATTIAGGTAAVATLLPFVASMGPPEKSRAAGAPVRVDISPMLPGAMITVAWRGVPVFLVNRTPAMLRAVVLANSMVADPSTERPFSMPMPDYYKNEYRSRADHQNLLVVVGVSTHLGCRPALASRQVHRRTCPIAGRADFYARVTARRTTWPAAALKKSPHRRISTCRVSRSRR